MSHWQWDGATKSCEGASGLRYGWRPGPILNVIARIGTENDKIKTRDVRLSVRQIRKKRVKHEENGCGGREEEERLV